MTDKLTQSFLVDFFQSKLRLQIMYCAIVKRQKLSLKLYLECENCYVNLIADDNYAFNEVRKSI